MFLNFFDELRAAKVPVTLREYLALLEGMDKQVIEMKVEEFYYLSRSILVKDERNLDKFDRVFSSTFKGVTSITDPLEGVALPIEHTEGGVAGADQTTGFVGDVLQEFGQVQVGAEQQRGLEESAQVAGILDGIEYGMDSITPVAHCSKGSESKGSRPSRMSTADVVEWWVWRFACSCSMTMRLFGPACGPC
jgi:uncharacterized protein with von Willebrand factor type A (vWA) domain